MTRVVIIPQKDKIYSPADFEISVARRNDDDSYKFYKRLPLGNDFRVDADLWVNDIIGVTYKGLTQLLNDSPADTDHTTYTVKKLVPEIKLYLQGAKGDGSEVTSNIIENEVGVHVKSLNLAEPIQIKLTPSTGVATKDQAFWDLINSYQFDFNHYRNFIDDVLSFEPQNNAKSKGQPQEYPGAERKADARRLPFNRTEAYSLLKFATERYVEKVYKIKNHLFDHDLEKPDLGDYLGRDKIIPYYDLIKSKIKEYFVTDPNAHETGFLQAHADATLIELIWNYWYEEGRVNQSMAAIARRFQNIKNGFKDPLLNFALDPLRPLNNILWGYIQDAQHRLTPTRKNYEYASEYNLCVLSNMKTGFNPADRSSNFLQSFHQLIYEATEYFVQADNTTIRPDGFKLLNALRDTHRVLAEGAHNQFGDLPTVARIETLMEQWILSRPEIREFLGGRVMVPYEEPWMDRVDSMKTLQGWDNTNISFYRDLAVYGEKIILGIRYGDWTNITRRDHATNWADAFRDAIQRYIHSYYTVTGIDLSAQSVHINSEERYLLPGMLIQQKRMRQKQFLRKY
ncbi:hypothetical protein [Mucilaginibacter aquaedulcis]|uniref:hypothetical protein n=1 Tax=Mucilaginibacter aquaedulcis TaxID=1187081 RepID=UPI0025B3C9D2|nr:hypothetical protein [Mucilaginibacter aquaedulcis]MDN3548635.1 hypothetical protein [Mucilaginibacter aquaedulcis]